MGNLLHQIDPSGVLGYVFLAGVICGQLLIGRSLRASLREHGKRIGRAVGRVNKIEGHLKLKDGDPDGGE